MPVTDTAVPALRHPLPVNADDSTRSTPELSFAIRHLNAVSGCMFSASHNLPTDNGKKVYDQYGGQLIPPHDQELVDEGLVEKKRGRGMFVNEGAHTALLKAERQRFLEKEWPLVQATIERLGLNTEELLLRESGKSGGDDE